MTKPHYLISMFLFGFMAGVGTFVAIWSYTEIEKADQPKPEPHKCKCLTYRQLSYYSTKYDIYMDSLNYAPKKDRPRLEDSVRKFGQILRKNY